MIFSIVVAAKETGNLLAAAANRLANPARGAKVVAICILDASRWYKGCAVRKSLAGRGIDDRCVRRLRRCSALKRRSVCFGAKQGSDLR